MEKFFGLIARVLLSLIFFISVLFILNNIITTPNGYTMYQDMLGARGLPGIFAPINILIQFIAGLSLILGYKIKMMAYILSGYALIWAIVYFLNALGGQPLLLASLQYLAITGGLFHLASNPNTGISLDSYYEGKKKK
jgi:putative oxidoreductase